MGSLAGKAMWITGRQGMARECSRPAVAEGGTGRQAGRGDSGRLLPGRELLARIWNREAAGTAVSACPGLHHPPRSSPSCFQPVSLREWEGCRPGQQGGCFHDTPQPPALRPLGPPSCINAFATFLPLRADVPANGPWLTSLRSCPSTPGALERLIALLF